MVKRSKPLKLHLINFFAEQLEACVGAGHLLLLLLLEQEQIVWLQLSFRRQSRQCNGPWHPLLKQSLLQ